MLAKMEAKRDTTLKEMKEEIKASKEEIIAELKVYREEIKASKNQGEPKLRLDRKM
jgi:hypothetical protein